MDSNHSLSEPRLLRLCVPIDLSFVEIQGEITAEA
jgi:hypothetical protein